MDLSRVMDCLATSYRLDLDGMAYVQALVEDAVPVLDHGLGVLSYTYDARDLQNPVIDHFAVSSRFDPAWLPPFYAAIEAASVDVGRLDRPTGFHIWGALSCAQASTVPGLDEMNRQFVHIGGAVDVFAMNARDASGRGLWLGAPLPTTRRVKHVPIFERLCAHLTTAVRLRRNAGASKPTPAAVIAPGGKLLHVESEESIIPARESLRQATIEFDRARSKKMRRDVDAATRRWRPLVKSRWSLLDDFDSDGRRFVVAVENRPPTRALTTELSEREHQVLTQAHLGHSNKVIAYELGLAASTVRVLLHRAAVKLGATTREELLRKFGALAKPPR